MSDQYTAGPTFTLAVADTSVGFTAASLNPTTNDYAMEIAIIQAVGPLYIETGGGAATTSSFPMAAGDSISISGYANLKNLRFIRNTNTTSVVVIPMYR
jgi:hypothetical protein